MKSLKRLFTAPFLIFILISAILTPVLPVSAAVVTVTVSPITGTPGSQVVASGNSFTAGSAYTVTFAVSFTSTTVYEGTVPAGGQVNAVFPVPVLPRGQYTVKITTDKDTTKLPAPIFTITPQIFLNTTAGMVADQINVSGNGFNANQKINIYFDTSAIGSVTTDAQGAFYTAAVTIPQATAGKHTILVKDSSGSTPGVPFSINPTISLSAVEATVGSTITVSGIGFASSKTVFVLIDDRPVTGTITSDSSGKFTGFTLKIPELIGGKHKVTARDSQEYTATTDFSINPSISINPDHGAVGTNVTVTGKGFPSLIDNPITIAFNGLKVVTNPETVTTGVNGSFGATFMIPSGTGSAGTVTVSDRFSTLSTPFNSAANITVNPLSGYVGTEITATGIGFKSAAVIKISYDSAEVGTITADTDGKFTTTFSALPSAAGNHQITITDQVSTLQAVFNVVPQLNTNLSSGSVGQEFSASGTGFTASSNVTVKYDITQVATTTTDKDGTFTVTFKVPASEGGSHRITFTDGVNKPITSDFSMDSTAPPAPTLLSPASSSKASATPTLKWQNATDPSGVTYSLEIAEDATFNILELQKDGLKQSEYMLTSQEVLGNVSKDTPYYWRVKAIDGANNQSDWSTPFTFYVGDAVKKTNYVIIIVGICVGVGGIAFLIEWLRRR